MPVVTTCIDRHVVERLTLGNKSCSNEDDNFLFLHVFLFAMHHRKVHSAYGAYDYCLRSFLALVVDAFEAKDALFIFDESVRIWVL